MIIQTFAPEIIFVFFNMDTTKTTAVLFDFDGVVMDTETQYSVFWHKAGVDYLGMDDLESRIKGQTMTYIYDTFFAGKIKEQQEITAALNAFERDMAYDYIPGVLDFIADLRRNHVKMAVVTSSNDRKMAAVYRARPEVRTMFDLLGMEVFGTTPGNTYVFEDSFNGLKAGMASEATVIGLATTNSREAIAPLCHCVLDDFTGFTYDKMLQVHK